MTCSNLSAVPALHRFTTSKVDESNLLCGRGHFKEYCSYLCKKCEYLVSISNLNVTDYKQNTFFSSTEILM